MTSLNLASQRRGHMSPSLAGYRLRSVGVPMLRTQYLVSPRARCHAPPSHAPTHAADGCCAGCGCAAPCQKVCRLEVRREEGRGRLLGLQVRRFLLALRKASAAANIARPCAKTAAKAIRGLLQAQALRLVRLVSRLRQRAHQDQAHEEDRDGHRAQLQMGRRRHVPAVRGQRRRR